MLLRCNRVPRVNPADIWVILWGAFWALWGAAAGSSPVMTDTDVPRHDPVSLGKNSPPVRTGLQVRPGVVCAVGGQWGDAHGLCSRLTSKNTLHSCLRSFDPEEVLVLGLISLTPVRTVSFCHKDKVAPGLQQRPRRSLRFSLPLTSQGPCPERGRRGCAPALGSVVYPSG